MPPPRSDRALHLPSFLYGYLFGSTGGSSGTSMANSASSSAATPVIAAITRHATSKYINFLNIEYYFTIFLFISIFNFKLVLNPNFYSKYQQFNRFEEYFNGKRF